MAGKNCTIYLVRHGETDNNKYKIIQGSRVDAPLNPTGEAQAKAAAEKLKQVKFATAFSSDLARAKRTAEIIMLEHQLAVVTKKILRERGLGELEGKSEKIFYSQLKDLMEQFEVLSDREKFKFNFPFGIEKLDLAVSRLITFLREISIAYRGKAVLVVSHGALIRHFLIHIGWATFKQLKWHPGQPPPVQNLGTAVIESDGVDFFVKDTFGINKSI